jgi:hypothetical protein
VDSLYNCFLTLIIRGGDYVTLFCNATYKVFFCLLIMVGVGGIRTFLRREIFQGDPIIYHTDVYPI